MEEGRGAPEVAGSLGGCCAQQIHGRMSGGGHGLLGEGQEVLQRGAGAAPGGPHGEEQLLLQLHQAIRPSALRPRG